MDANDPETGILPYGRPRGFYREPLLVRAWRRMPKPSRETVAWFVVAVVGVGWFAVDHAAWVRLCTLPLPASFSADGRRGAYAGEPGTADEGVVTLCDVDGGRRRTVLPRQPDVVSDVALSPDGTRLVTSCARRASLWDTAAVAEVATWSAHADTNVFHFSPDGRTLAGVGQDGLEFRDGRTGALLHSLGPPPGPKGWYKCRFSPDGRFFAAVVGPDVVCWEAAGGREVLRVAAPEDELSDHAFAGPGRIAVKLHQFVRLYDLPDGRLVDTYTHDSFLLTGWAAPDGSRVYVHDLSETVVVWVPGAGVRPTTMPVTGQVLGISRDGTRVLTLAAESEGRLQLRRGDGTLLEAFDVPPRPTDDHPVIEDLSFLGEGNRRVIVSRIDGDGTGVGVRTAEVWRHRRPARWYGLAWLPQFWAAVLTAGALVWSIMRDVRAWRARRAGAPSTPRPDVLNETTA